MSRYNTPDHGSFEDLWHEPLNENFEDIEADIVVLEEHDHDGETIAPAAIESSLTDGNLLSNIAGENLGIDENGNLNAATGGEGGDGMETHGNEWHDPNFAFQSDFNTLESDYDSHVVDDSAHHEQYTDAEAITAVETGDVTVHEATFWDGYELVFDNETPDTNQYIRFVTEDD